MSAFFSPVFTVPKRIRYVCYDERFVSGNCAFFERYF
jgi:hypothetical protein